jgi:predicted GIY-YIG superfamily endonuclease
VSEYIYVIASNPNGPVKIGRSADPPKRLKQLQTGHAQPLSIHYQQEISGDEVNLMERAVHKTIRHKRLKGEWFSITVEEAIFEVKHAVILFEDNLRPTSAKDRLNRLFD